MRYFISVDVDNEGVKESLASFTERLREYGDVTVVDPGKMHITLLFIGEHDASEESDITDMFVKSCDEINEGEFKCSVENIGVFPEINYIKVVWAGVKPEEKFVNMHMTFSEVMNIESEHSFVPHITLERVRGIDGADKRALQQMIREKSPVFGTMQVNRVRLKASESGPDGPAYRDVEVVAL